MNAVSGVGRGYSTELLRKCGTPCAVDARERALASSSLSICLSGCLLAVSFYVPATDVSRQAHTLLVSISLFIRADSCLRFEDQRVFVEQPFYGRCTPVYA